MENEKILTKLQIRQKEYYQKNKILKQEIYQKNKFKISNHNKQKHYLKWLGVL